MKKRTKGNRRSLRAPRRKALEVIAGRSKHKRRTWTFEHLEERHFLSATQELDITPVMYSSNTLEGLQQILINEMMWATLAANPDVPINDILAELRALPNDPYLEYQWHLINLGQTVGNPDWQEILATPGEDINVLPAWDLGYTGEGVYVAVVDSGVELTHPDLAANISEIYRFDALTGDDDPSPVGGAGHGTSVAGLIGAVGDNGVGMTGVAYDVTLVPIRLVDAGITDETIADALRYENQVVDIYNNSWGPSDATRAAAAPGPLATLALRDGVTFGRDGLGSIYVWAAGNGAGPFSYFSPGWFGTGTYDSAQYDGYVNSRYTIGVGGIDHDGSYNNSDGTATTYPEAGAAILVVAPTGSVSIDVGLDTGTGSGIWTTDLTGDDGYNQAPEPNGYEADRDFFPDTDYTSRFNGTSASAPIVSGVIALMLEANPNLSWRDVQEILVRSARQADIEDPTSGLGFGNEQSWLVNYRDFFRIPDPIEETAPLSADFNPFVSVFAPEAEVSASANPAFYPDNLYFNIIIPSTIVIPPIAGDPDADPPVQGDPGQVYFEGVYELPYAPVYTNGAGYTVSAGRGAFGDEFGYGHGVVDAELAVELARQWTIQDQTLPPELSYTQYVIQTDNLVIKAGQISSEESGQLLVPGAFTGSDDGFIDFWEQYFEEVDPDDPNSGPFSDEDGWDGGTPGDRGGFLYFKVPDSNAMRVEWVEFKVDISNASADLNELRLTLVSPDGTESELISQFPRNDVYSLQTNPASIYTIGGLESIADGEFVWTFSTNRNWGERYDNQYVIAPPEYEIDDVTGELVLTGEGGTPVLDDAGTPFDDSDLGAAVERGWMIVAENYSGTDIDIEGWEIVWHGSPIDADSQRVQGIVGVDSGYEGDGARDGQYAFSSFSQKTEEGAANVTVVATRVSDGVQTKFVTGADGNFYFDLVPDEYIISIQDPEGRTALDEANVPASTLPLYQEEWHITEDWFYQADGYYEPVFVPNLPERPYGIDDYLPDANFRVYDDGSGAPVHFVDGTGLDLAAGPRYINFLLDPGPLPENQTVVSGQVFADLDGDGVYNNDDAPAVDFIVYADTNHTGQFEITDPFVLTDQSGNYQLYVSVTSTERYDIGAVAPTSNWEQTYPESSTIPILAYPGATVPDIDFGFEPIVPPEPPPVPDPGSILGVVYEDANQNGVRDGGEEGVAGVHVYVDLDNSLNFTVGEPEAVTGSNGAYFLGDVDPAVVLVRIDTPTDWALTSPTSGYRSVNLSNGGAVSNVLFGIRNLATNDWGDLPDSFRTTAAADGPSHVVLPGFQLGAKIDAEVNGKPSAAADGDDNLGADEDGVVVLDVFGDPDPNRVLRVGDATDPNATKLRVTVSGVGGLLTGWIDFDASGAFESDEKVTWKDPEGNLVQEVDLNPGTYDLSITVPASLASGQIAARFRWGEAGLDYFGASDTVGEVEDYLFDPLPTQPSVVLDGDYNTDSIVDDSDYLVWKATFGSSSDLRADGNGDGIVDAADYGVWRDHYGETAGSGSGSMVVESDSGSSRSAPTYSGFVAKTVEELDPEYVAYMESQGYQFRTVRVGLNDSRVMVFKSAGAATVATSTQTADSLSRASMAEASLLSLDALAGEFTTTVDGGSAALLVQQSAGQDGVASTADLQLLDEVLEQMAVRSDDDQVDDLVTIGQDDDQNSEVTDLALAAVFADEVPWWLGV